MLLESFRNVLGKLGGHGFGNLEITLGLDITLVILKSEGKNPKLRLFGEKSTDGINRLMKVSRLY